jgi:hypothetical protein
MLARDCNNNFRGHTMMRILTAAILLFASMTASADTMQYSLCTLNDGKTMGDAQAWVSEWSALVKKEKIDYAIRLLIPHASTEQAGQFFIEGSTPTLSSYAAAWEWWYADEDALASNAQLVAAASCGSNSIYVTAD